MHTKNVLDVVELEFGVKLTADSERKVLINLVCVILVC